MTLADVRPAKPAPISANALILVAIFTALAFALARLPDPPGVLTFAFVVVGWVLSVVVHEFAHAFVAYKAGDHTIVEKGYLSLDPLKYTDLQTSLILPLVALAIGGIGFPGGAVYLRDDLMRSKRGGPWPRWPGRWVRWRCWWACRCAWPPTAPSASTADRWRAPPPSWPSSRPSPWC
jgi:hypothetical protein